MPWARGRVLLGNGDELRAPILINAAGEWASELTPGLPVAMRKGILRSPNPIRDFTLPGSRARISEERSCHNHGYRSLQRAAKANGQLLIGSSRQYGARAGKWMNRYLARMLQRAAEYLPVLPSLSIERSWTGFRSATPDKLPLIGPSLKDETVFLATGHEGLGITTSFATAQLLADLIRGQKKPAIPIAPYLPPGKPQPQLPPTGSRFCVCIRPPGSARLQPCHKYQGYIRL